MYNMENVETAPLRSLDDFLLSSARFQVPNFRDPERCVHRIINNLLYYQSNYFLAAIIIFLIVGIMNPVQMFFGVAAFLTAFVGFVYATNNQVQCSRFKRKYPGLSVFVVLILGYALVYLFGSVIVFLFGIAVPLLCILIHSSLRMRNLKQKALNKIEFIGLKRTPMGIILEALGQEQEAWS